MKPLSCWSVVGVFASLLVAAAVGSPACANMTFAVRSADNGSFIVVSGEFEYSDSLDEFARLVTSNSPKFITFNSPGGNISKAIELGHLIRQASLNTVQLKSLECESACALAFFGGVHRFADPGSIGVHRATFADLSNMNVASAVSSIQQMTAIEIAYMSEMGIDPALMQVALNYDSSDIRYLSGSEMADYKVTTDPVPNSAPPAVSTDSTGPGATPRDWSTFGEWIQIFSRQVLSQALSLATAYRGSATSPLIFRYDNGWFVGAIGPFPGGTASAERDRMVASGSIPNDSLVVTGSHFAELLSGQAPDRSLQANAPDLSARAVAAAQSYEQSWSLPNKDALDYLDALYGSEVTYFGQPTPKQTVMQEKAKFAERWPERIYTIEPGTTRATCTPDQVCSVQGIVDWQATSQVRKTTSSGSASFELIFAMTNPIRLLSETSSVLSRQTTSGSGNTASLPLNIGECRETTITQVGNRLLGTPGSGSAISYANGGYQVSYDQVGSMDSSRAGDAVNLCLISIPSGCPPGDNRGRTYRATNLRTGRVWEAPDAEHMCGGA